MGILDYYPIYHDPSGSSYYKVMLQSCKPSSYYKVILQSCKPSSYYKVMLQSCKLNPKP